MNSSQKIRTRFAPSPTGYPHVGSIWQALMHWLYARHNGGIMVLRIEDTDQKRYVEDAEQRIFEALAWYGLDHDEGPDVGGNYGPYRQSERLELYREHAERLIADGNAYPCFCSAERLEAMRKEQEAQKMAPRYDGLCRKIDPQEAATRRAQETHVIRMKFPETGETRFTDAIRGEVVFRNELIDDQVLMKSDGWPTYHLAVVVDDHLMEISTVIRGEEWLSSTPKHLALYDMFGWQAPQFAHLPLLLGADRSKLSKRHGSTEAMKFREEGYLPDALINFFALLGWSSKSDQEIFTRQELVEKFSLEGVNKAGAIFDRTKLQWMNAQYLKQLPLDALVEACWPFLERAGLINAHSDRAYVAKVLAASRDRLKTLADCVDETALFFQEPEYQASALIWKKSDEPLTIDRLTSLLEFLNNTSEADFTEAKLEEGIKQLIETKGYTTGDTLWPMRVALSGREQSPGPFALAAVFGKLEVLNRIKKALAKFQ